MIATDHSWVKAIRNSYGLLFNRFISLTDYALPAALIFELLSFKHFSLNLTRCQDFELHSLYVPNSLPNRLKAP
jgi:hypothetical protein